MLDERTKRSKPATSAQALLRPGGIIVLSLEDWVQYQQQLQNLLAEQELLHDRHRTLAQENAELLLKLRDTKRALVSTSAGEAK